MEAVRGNLKMLEEAAIDFEEEQQPAAGVMFPPERGHVKASAFFGRILYSCSHRSSVNTGVFCDVALHVVGVMKSKAARLLYLSHPTQCCQHTLAHSSLHYIVVIQV